MNLRNGIVFLLLLGLFLGRAEARDNRGVSRKFKAKKRIIHREINYTLKQNWLKLANTERGAVQALITLLEKSKTGKVLLRRAEKKAMKGGQQLLDVLLAGEGSLTDTTLIRKFYPSQPDNVIYESRSKVFINRRLNVKDALLDMAHELTHFSYRMPFNPYQGPFDLKRFVTSTVEGKGGEVEAYLVECKVLFELIPSERERDSNCLKVVEPTTGRLSKRRGVQQFYRVGRHSRHFRRNLTSFDLSLGDFPRLSSSDALFISSAYGLPYPLAAIKEYKVIMGKACQNDHKRLGLLRQQLKVLQGTGRSPARENLYYNLSESYKTRCRNFPAS